MFSLERTRSSSPADIEKLPIVNALGMALLVVGTLDGWLSVAIELFDCPCYGVVGKEMHSSQSILG